MRRLVGQGAFVQMFDISCFMLVFGGRKPSLGYSITWTVTTSELSQARSVQFFLTFKIC